MWLNRVANVNQFKLPKLNIGGRFLQVTKIVQPTCVMSFWRFPHANDSVELVCCWAFNVQWRLISPMSEDNVEEEPGHKRPKTNRQLSTWHRHPKMFRPYRVSIRVSYGHSYPPCILTVIMYKVLPFLRTLTLRHIDNTLFINIVDFHIHMYT